MTGRSGAEREDPRALYDLLVGLWEVGGGLPDLEYDAQGELFRFTEDGRFAISKNEADWELLEQRELFDAL